MQSSRIIVLLIPFLLIGCDKPADIVFGPEPVKQMVVQGEEFKKLPKEDRTLLVDYLTMAEAGKVFGINFLPITGRTVGEVLIDARAWKVGMKEIESASQRHDSEQAALKEKTFIERKAIIDKITSCVLIAVTGKEVLPKNYDAGRYSEMLVISYVLENKSVKAIRQIKGRVFFYDAIGDGVGSLSVDFNQRIQPGKTLKTTTGIGWKLNEFMRGDIEKIAERDFSSMKTRFEADAIAFDDGEVLRAPQTR